MKELKKHLFDANKARSEWNNYDSLLQNNSELAERKDVLPFFKKSHNLSLLIGKYYPNALINPDCFAHEFGIYGDFIADLIVGDSKTHQYVLIEFENGNPNSIFKKPTSTGKIDWASRFEGAYSQLIDWLWKLEDMRSTSDFTHTFGNRRAKFHGLIVIGKNMNLASQEQNRLDWRLDKTRIDSKEIAVISFDQLLTDFDDWLKYYRI